MSKYDDIINYDFKMKHDRMSIQNRSFQFAPFSALTGYKELIIETGREVDKKIEIDEEKYNELNYKLNIIRNNIQLNPLVTITYFIKDLTKNGGSYQKINVHIKKIDFYHKLIILDNKEKIKIENIIDINSNDVIFDDINN